MAKFIKIYPENPNEREIQKVVDCLREGGVIIYPTDTVYGLDYVKQIDTTTFKLLKRALPGAYTFILPGSNNLPKEFKKKKTVGIRIPDNTIARTLVEKLGNPIVSSSIYDEDEVLEYTTDPELIFEKWQDKVDIVIDGGYGDNVASTVIDLSSGVPELIRQGKGSIEGLW